MKTLDTLLGDYAVTAALKTGRVAARDIAFRFADVKAPSTAFKRVVRGLEFDVAELAIVTFLLAKAYGKPLRLLPAVITARFQHPLLVYDSARGPLVPEDLNGKRIGERSHSVTTATWVRGMLASDYGVDLDGIAWVTFEDPHVAEFDDPPNVERASADKDMIAMLLDGELDAAIVGEPPKDARIRPLIADAPAAAKAWREKQGAIQINHMIAVRSSLDRAVSQEVFQALARSRESAGNPEMNPFGVEANRRNLEVVIDCVYSQRMIPRRFTVDELFD